MSSGMMRAKPRPLDGKRRDKSRKFGIYANLGKSKDGKYKKVERVFHGTYAQACEAMEELRRQYENVSADSIACGLTFQEAAEKWVRRSVAFGEITEATGRKKRDYLSSVSHHIGGRRLAEVNARLLDDVYESLLLGDSPSGRKLTQTTIACIARTVNQMLNEYARRGDIPKVHDLRTFSEKPKERRTLTHEQVAQVSALLDTSDHHHVAVALYLLAGLRRSEALTLTWGDYDRQNGLLHVHGTKSEAADAVVPLRAELCRILDEWRAFQSMRMELNGARHGDSVRIVSFIGEEVQAKSIQRWWTRNRAALGCDGLRLHELRHTFVTECARAGLPTTVTASLARDKDVRVIEKVYTHIGMEEKKRAVQALDAAII